MRRQRVATGFTTYAENALLIKSQTIVLKMTGSLIYTDPVPSISDLNEITGAYGLNLSSTPSKANTQQKKENRLILIDMLNRLALYVAVTGSSLAEYEESGFSLTSIPQPVGVLGKAQNFTAKPFHAGNMQLSLNKITGADGYCFQYAQIVAGQPLAWESVQSTKARVLIPNLISGSQYAFRVYGIGSNPTIVFSDQINSFVL